MANSYKLYTGNNSTKIFALSGIDGWVSTAFIKVYLNDVLQTTGYSFITMSTAPSVEFGTAPGTGVTIRLQRETARVSGSLDLSAFQSNIIDFSDGSVLTAGDLDKAVQGLVHVAQESNDSGSGALGLNVTQTAWTAGNKKITEVTDGTNAQDAVTVNQFNLATLFGGSAMQPELWSITATGTDTYTLSPAPSGLNENLFFVTIDGVVQPPSAYNLTPTTIVFSAVVASPKLISIRNFGVARSLVSSVQTAMIVDANVTTAKLNDSSVTAAKLDSNSVTTAKITDANVTYAKIQNVSATNKLLGRVTAGSGVVEEVTCTPLAQTFLTKTSEADQRTALQLQPLALKTTVGTTDIDNASVTFAKMQTVGANVVLGTTTAGTIGTLPNTAFGLSLLNTASSTTAKSTLGITPTIEIRNFTTASVSTTNHIEVILSNAGAYGELNKEFVIVCNFTCTGLSPTTAGQDLFFTGIDIGAVWRISYNVLKVQNTVSSQVPKPQVSNTVFETIFRGASNGSTFPASGYIPLLPVAHVTEEPTETQVYTGDGTDNTFEVCGSLGSGTNSVDVDDYIVTLNNVLQPPSAYTINSSSKALSFTAGAPAAGVAILIRTLKSYRSNTFTVNSNYTYTNIITVERIG